jgi:hypothetical protein
LPSTTRTHGGHRGQARGLSLWAAGLS